MRKIFTFLLFALWLPIAMTGQTVYVGGVALTGGTDNPTYATTDESGNVSTEGASADNYNIKWDGSTLTLKNAYITNEAHNDNYTHPVEGAAIGVFNQSGAAELSIQLEGSNTIAEVSTGIYVLAFSNSTGDASLTITGNGSLNASGSQTGIWVQSNSGDAALTIQNADVEATGTSSSGNGVVVQSSENSSASLTVNGGSLTATGSGAAGIEFNAGGENNTITTKLSVDSNALVDTRGGGINVLGKNSETGGLTPTGTGIVFDGKDGTVYGNVTLQENITISEGESLNIPEGSSLTVPDGKTLTVNGGELTGNVPQSGVVYKVTEVTLSQSTLTLNVGDEETLTATIKPENATNKNVIWTSENEDIATVGNGKVTAMGVGSTTITATVDGKSASCSVTVNKATPEYTVPTGLTATYGDKLSDITLPEGWAWEDGTQSVGNVGDNTFTAIFTPDDTENYNTATAEVTVTVKQADISEQIKAEGETTISLDLETGSTILTAYVEGDGIPTDGRWKWKYDKSVVTLEKIPETRTIVSQSSRKVIPVSVGTTTITATYTDDNYNYSGSVSYMLTVTKAEEPETPVFPDMPEYYNIMVEECEGVTVETSSDVVREGQSMTFTVDVAEGYTAENMVVKVKRSLFGTTDVIEPNDEGIYEVKNIYTDIYLTIDGVEEEEEETPTGMEDVESAKVYTKDGSIYVQTPKQEQVQIISISGAVLKNETQIGLQRYDLPRGIYVICIGEERFKVRN